MLTVIKEDGSGKADANSYASRADGDAYHEGHLYATAWTGATDAQRDAALVMATRVIDAVFAYNGSKRSAAQSLAWPRVRCPDPDLPAGGFAGWPLARGSYLDEASVPAAVANATVELARELLVADRTEAPEGEGLVSFQIAGGLSVVFDVAHRRPMVPALVKTMLARLGDYVPAVSGQVRLVRC
jgi:hypothetical protein